MKIAIFLIGTIFSSTLLAQNPEKNNNGWSVSASLANTWINSESAEIEGISDTSLVLRQFGSYQHNVFLISIGLDIYFLDDNESFSQLTENEFTGDLEYSNSSANAFGVFVAAGPQWHLGKNDKIILYTQAGYDIVSAERSISNCSNCFEEDIQLEGGLFINGGIKYAIHQQHQIGLQLQEYISSDDLERAIAAGYTFSF